MKLRKDFVTNSSSSSFICVISGGSEGGYDCSLEDVGMGECSNGHVMYQEYILDRPINKEGRLSIIKEIIESVNSEYGSFRHKLSEFNSKYPNITIGSAKDLSDDELDEIINYCIDVLDYELIEDYYSFNIGLCPICNKEEVPSDKILDYILKKYNIDIAEVKDVYKHDDSINYYK